MHAEAVAAGSAPAPQGQGVEAAKMCTHPACACQMKVRWVLPSSPYSLVASALETLAEQAVISATPLKGYTSQLPMEDDSHAH